MGEREWGQGQGGTRWRCFPRRESRIQPFSSRRSSLEMLACAFQPDVSRRRLEASRLLRNSSRRDSIAWLGGISKSTDTNFASAAACCVCACAQRGGLRERAVW